MRASSMQHKALQMSYILRCRPYGRSSRRSDAPMTRNCERHVAAIAVSVAARVPAIRPFTSTCSTLRPTTSQRGTRLFFEWLEDRFGGRLPMAKTTPENPQVVVAPQLTARDLQRLFRHEITVLQVRNFYPKASALQLGQELAEHAMSQRHDRNDQHQRDSHILKNWKVSTARGLESSDVFTLGAHVPFNIAASQGDDGIKEYFDNVPTEFRERRRRQNDTTKPLWPLDQLRLELDEIWPHGAGLAKVTRRRGKRGDGDATDATWTMGGGLPRIMMGPTRWAKGFVHVDELAPLSMNSGLFSANIYLQLPSTKPHNHPNEEFPRKSDRQEVLEIWPLSIMNRWDWYRVRHIFKCRYFSTDFHRRFRALLTSVHCFVLRSECQDAVIFVIARR